MKERPIASVHLDSGREFRGGQRQVLFLLGGLQRRGHRVLLCCPRAGRLFGAAHAAGIPCEPLTIRSGLDFPSSVRLARIVADAGFDLVHAHDSHSHSIARAAQGISHEPALTANLVVSRRSVGGDSGALGRIKYAAAGIHYIAISQPVAKALERQGVPAERITIVPSGVDIAALAAARAQRSADPWGLMRRGARVVGTIGHLSREKNHALLLQAFAQVRAHDAAAHLLLVGDGPLRKALEKRTRDLGLEPHVTFAGHLEDIRPAYAALDVFALSSDIEGLCTSVLDAMAAGVPVATTAAGGVLAIARHGVSALVVPPRDAAALGGAIVRLLQPSELVTELIAGGRAVAADHSTDLMVERTLRVYQRLQPASQPLRERRPAERAP